MIAGGGEDLTIDIDQRCRHDVRVADHQSFHGLADGADLTCLRELGELNREGLADFFALIQKRATFVARQSKHHVADEDHAQRQGHKTKTHPHEGIDAELLELEPFEFQLFHRTNSRVLLFARGINRIQQALNAFFLPVIVLLSILVGLLSNFHRHRRGGPGSGVEPPPLMGSLDRQPRSGH